MHPCQTGELLCGEHIALSPTDGRGSDSCVVESIIRYHTSKRRVLIVTLSLRAGLRSDLQRQCNFTALASRGHLLARGRADAVSRGWTVF